MSGARPSRLTRADGFTLVELIVTIVITAVVMAFVVLFLDVPVESYFAQTRRADLTDFGQRIADAVTVDARTALPNSLRVARQGNRWALEFLATIGVARYYGQGDKTGDPNAQAEELSLGIPDGSFHTMNPFTGDSGQYTGARAPYLSVGNLGINLPGGQNAYDSGPSCAVQPCAMTSATGSPSLRLLAQGEESVQYPPIIFEPNRVSNGLPNHNAYLVSTPVSYVCDPAAGTLTRYSGYALSGTQQVPPAQRAGTVVAVIARDVTRCGPFSVLATQPYQYRFGEIAILNITLASGGESFQVFVEAPTEYTQ